jgi:deoxyxylulose-5-phosphate synthase
MGLIELPSSREFIESVDWVIPSDKRDFRRSTPDWAITFPRDSNLSADAQDVPWGHLKEKEEKDKADKAAKQFATNVQKLMQTGPLGARYSGPVDGKVNPSLLASLRKLESALQFHTGEAFIGSIVFGNNVISQSGIQKAVKALRNTPWYKKKNEKKIKKPKENIISPEASAQIVKSFQSFFSATQPLIGALYSGPADGKVNPQLIAAAKQAESAIASAIGSKSVHGALWSDKSKTFNTSPSDLKDALQLIVKHKFNKKVSKLNAEGRIVHFSSILINNSL